jgi:hypothetical protein
LFFLFNYEKRPKSIILEKSQEFKEHYLIDENCLKIIEKINEKNNKINCFKSDCRIKVWEGNKKYTLNGSINYKKLNFFKMQIYSFFGKELDIGSNKNLFWYWSKRDKNPGLYWAYYQDFHKTRLKTPFSPIFMRSTLGLEKIEIKNSYFSKNNNNYMISYERKNSIGEKIFFSILLNKKLECIKGFLITDAGGNLLSSCEIEWIDNIPNKILYNWKEENKTMLIELKNSSTNIVLEENIFEMPYYKPQINMAYE